MQIWWSLHITFNELSTSFTVTYDSKYRLITRVCVLPVVAVVVAGGGGGGGGGGEGGML